MRASKAQESLEALGIARQIYVAADRFAPACFEQK
jgi:hypothetical protein